LKRIRSSVRVSRAWVEAYCAESAPILLTRRQVATKLHISVNGVGTLLRRGMLPTVKLGKIQRISAAGVNEFLKRNTFLRPNGAKSAPVPRTTPKLGEVPPMPVRRSRFSNVRECSQVHVNIKDLQSLSRNPG
jgi:hypothetical protein